ncbi:MAG: hypothetical protein AAFO82_03100 [Bacteroidota bacterium]
MEIEKAQVRDATQLSSLCMRYKSFRNYSEEQIEEWKDELTITETYIQENEVYMLKEDELMVFSISITTTKKRL